MPTYEYRCKECGTQFDIEETMSEHDGAQHECPECGSDDVRRVFSGGHVQTTSKT